MDTDTLEQMDKRELISALADGQLRGDGLARGVQAAASDDGLATWQAYCVIGEVLRSGQASAGTAPAAFLARLQARLQDEPARAVAAVEVAPVAAALHAREPANDWRWKMVAGVASVAAVAAVGWNVWGTAGGSASGPQLAAAPATGVQPVALSQPDPRSAPMIRDPRLDQLLQAHRQFGGSPALQAPPGFLRNATFEGPAR